MRALALAHIPVALVSKPDDPLRHSRFVAERVDWADPAHEPELLVERLLGFAAGLAEPPVLFFDGDWDLLVVSRHRDRLAAALRFVVPDAELVEDLVDKARFGALARRLGLPVPPGREVAPGDAGVADELAFPVVVKPLTREHGSWRSVARAKALRAATRDELQRTLAELAAAGIGAYVQEAVAGPERNIESYHVYVDARGEIAGEFTGRKLRTYPREFGYSTALELTDVDDVRGLGREIVSATGLRGVAKLDFKRDRRGNPLLLEINPRFSLWHHLGARGGVNLPEIVYADLVGAERPPVRPVRAGTRWCTLPRDAQAALAHRTPPLEWLRFVIGAEAKSHYDAADPAPALHHVLRLVRRRCATR